MFVKPTTLYNNNTLSFTNVIIHTYTAYDQMFILCTVCTFFIIYISTVEYNSNMSTNLIQ